MAVQPKSFVDVSSHNGEISIGDYRTLANKGVGGVVVKLTEDTWYKNPNAENQIRNAQAAGLQVSTYHFSRYTSEEAARAEARFYIAAAQRLNLPKNTLWSMTLKMLRCSQISTAILKLGWMKCVKWLHQLDVLH